MRFRPLTGKLVLINIIKIREEIKKENSFRPLTGKLVLIPCRPESLFSATHSGFCGADDEIRFFSVLIWGLDAAEALLCKARCGFWINAT